MIKLINKLPFIGKLKNEINKLKEEIEVFKSLFPPGHYYSPIPSIEDIKAREDTIFRKSQRRIAGVELNESTQLDLLKCFEEYYAEMPFGDSKQSGLRYYLDNSYYSYADGIFLYSMMRHIKPRRVIEVGSGFSSALMLDVNECFYNNSIELTFIEPHPERLNSLINDADTKNVRLLENKLEETPVSIFQNLTKNDILFIDSSHVSKAGSDVNALIFDILPVIASGVYIHIHDIFYPFEYPKNWIYKGVSWNEAYILRAFLQFNPKFEIILFTSYLVEHHKDKISDRLPLALRSEKNNPSLIDDAPGASLWIRKK